MNRLNNGQLFPPLAIRLIDGVTIELSQTLQNSYGVILLYRGAWCPYCQAQLGAFQRASARLAAAGIKVAALSVDDAAATAATIEKFKLTFPVGHGADAEQVAALTGAYVNDSPRYLQSTGFLLDRAGHVLNAVYSSGPIGRLVAEDVIGMVNHLKSKSR